MTLSIKTYSSEVEEWKEITFFAISALEDDKEYYESLIAKLERVVSAHPEIREKHKNLRVFYQKLDRIEEEIDLGYDILDSLDQGVIPEVLQPA